MKSLANFVADLAQKNQKKEEKKVYIAASEKIRKYRTKQLKILSDITRNFEKVTDLAATTLSDNPATEGYSSSAAVEEVKDLIWQQKQVINAQNAKIDKLKEMQLQTTAKTTRGEGTKSGQTSRTKGGKLFYKHSMIVIKI